MKKIIWNARGVGNRSTVRRLKYLVNVHKPHMVAVLEPMVDVNQGEDLKRSLGFDKFYTNNSGLAKIWVFGKASVQMEAVNVFNQALTVSLFDSDIGSMVYVTLVYASCDGVQRRSLWENLFSLAEMDYQCPWFVVGDFNSILSSFEKKGGCFPRQIYMNEFRDCLSSCMLDDASYIGSPFTWCNNQIGEDRILARLDRCLVNVHCQNL